MPNELNQKIKTVKVKAIIAARRGDVVLTLKLPGTTTLEGLHVACLNAVSAQSPEHSGKPIANLQYDVRANT